MFNLIKFIAMGKNNELVAWHGKVGKLVGWKSRGKHYFRQAGCSFHDANTVAQQETRAKLAFVSQLIHKIGVVYKLGYLNFNTSKSQRSNFFRNLWDDAVTGNMTDGYTVDYEKVKIARGLLLPTYSMTCSVLGAQHKCSYSWTDNSGQGDAEATDKICINLYNPTKGVSMMFEDVATRAAEACQVQYSTAWAGDTVYNYIFWKKADGSCSDSILVNFFVAE